MHGSLTNISGAAMGGAVGAEIKPTVHRAWDALAVEFTNCHVPALRMVDQLKVTQDPDDHNRVLPVLLIRPDWSRALTTEMSQRLNNCLTFTIKDATLPRVEPHHTVRLLIYPTDATRLVPMWMAKQVQPDSSDSGVNPFYAQKINCSCGLPWSWCHAVGPHHHTLRSRDFEEAFTATGHPTEVNGHG